MESKDEIYIEFKIKRSDVEARFAETEKLATDRSMVLIGDALRATPVEKLKEVILSFLLSELREATREKLREKGSV